MVRARCIKSVDGGAGKRDSFLFFVFFATHLSGPFERWAMKFLKGLKFFRVIV